MTQQALKKVITRTFYFTVIPVFVALFLILTDLTTFVVFSGLMLATSILLILLWKYKSTLIIDAHVSVVYSGFSLIWFAASLIRFLET